MELGGRLEINSAILAASQTTAMTCVHVAYALFQGLTTSLKVQRLSAVIENKNDIAMRLRVSNIKREGRREREIEEREKRDSE